MRLLAALLLTAGCTTMSDPQEPTPSPALSPGDQVTTAADRDAKSGKMVEVFGTYTEVAGGKDDGAPLDGHAAIALADGTLIHLAPPWHPEAIRSTEERRLAGQPVVGKGILFAECPPPGDGRAYAKVACLYLGATVVDRPTYDFLHGSDL